MVGKLRRAAIGIPAGKLLFGPINQLLAIKPRNIFGNRCPEVRETFQDWCQIICETGTEPTHVNNIVPGKAGYKATLDAPGEVAGGVWIPSTKALAPIVWRI